MWIEGRRRGGSKDLSKHLQKTENESVSVRELEGFSFHELTGKSLDKALRQMEAIGYSKGCKRNLYHAILAPAYGETLSKAQQDFMVDYYAEHMRFVGHQRVMVEHWKNGKQHFHLVFNIINPTTGKIHELKWTKRKEWQISRGLEEIFGLRSPNIKGKATRTWENQRSKHTGIDVRKMRKEVTAIYRNSRTTPEFIAALEKAGYSLTRGKKNQFVLVDRMGDTHGLLRRIEGAKLADLRRKFPGIDKVLLPSHDSSVKERKPAKPEPAQYAPIDPNRVREDVQAAYRTSKTGAAFFVALNKEEYSLGRGLKGFAVIDRNGDRHDLDRLLGKEAAKGLNKKFPDLAAIRPRPVSEIIRRIKAKNRKSARAGWARRSIGHIGGSGFAQKSTSSFKPSTSGAALQALFVKAARQTTTRTGNNLAPIKPMPSTKGWPQNAVIDWEVWGHRNPPRFFAKWPELAP